MATPYLAKALFLDRDGVINRDHGYVHSREEFEFLDGIFDLCRAAQCCRYRIFVVTNQAGIARGYYSEKQFAELTNWMVEEFSRQQIEIQRVYYCPFHPHHGVGCYKRDSFDRKPGPGMLLRAQAEFRLDLAASILIGDKTTDIQAAQSAGIGTAILLGQAEADDALSRYECAESLTEIQQRFFSSVRALET